MYKTVKFSFLFKVLLLAFKKAPKYEEGQILGLSITPNLRGISTVERQQKVNAYYTTQSAFEVCCSDSLQIPGITKPVLSVALCWIQPRQHN